MAKTENSVQREPFEPKTINVDALTGYRVLVDFGEGCTVTLTNDQARMLARLLRREAFAS